MNGSLDSLAKLHDSSFFSIKVNDFSSQDGSFSTSQTLLCRKMKVVSSVNFRVDKWTCRFSEKHKIFFVHLESLVRDSLLYLPLFYSGQTTVMK